MGTNLSRTGAKLFHLEGEGETLLLEKSDVIKKETNHKNTKSNCCLEIGIKPINLGVFHRLTVFLRATPTANENIAKTISIVNQARLIRFGGLERAEMIKAAPNQPAEILINQSEADRNNGGSILIKPIYQEEVNKSMDLDCQQAAKLNHPEGDVLPQQSVVKCCQEQV